MRKTSVWLSALAWAATAASNLQMDATRQPSLTFNVVAVDARNQPVRDLRAGDFRISDNGNVLNPASARFLETIANQAAPLGPNEYSNRPAGGNSHSTLVLFDLLNANFGERGFGWTDIALALQKLGPGERLYLYLLTKEGKLYPVHGLPADSARTEDVPWTAGVKPLLDKAMRAVNQLRPEELQIDADVRTRTTFAALESLMAEFGAQPGRKALVWISHGVPLLALSAPRRILTDYTPMVRELAKQLNRAGISVYPVDQSERSSDGLNSKNTLWLLAELTAGVWFPSDVAGKAIVQAAADTHAMYRIAYAPPVSNWDGKYHKLRVTCDRKGVQIRAMEGYYADIVDVSPKARLAWAALGADEAQDIGIRATATPSQKVPGWTHFQIHVDAMDLVLESGEHYTGEFRVTCVDYVTEWGPETAQATPVKLDLTAAQRDDLLRDGSTVVLDRPVNHAAQKMRVVVQDSLSGAVGSVTIPVSAANQLSPK
jgi:VWFA-related protein